MEDTSFPVPEQKGSGRGTRDPDAPADGGDSEEKEATEASLGPSAGSRAPSHSDGVPRARTLTYSPICLLTTW